MADIVVPDDPNDAVTPIDGDYDRPRPRTSPGVRGCGRRSLLRSIDVPQMILPGTLYTLFAWLGEYLRSVGEPPQASGIVIRAESTTMSDFEPLPILGPASGGAQLRTPPLVSGGDY